MPVIRFFWTIKVFQNFTGIGIFVFVGFLGRLDTYRRKLARVRQRRFENFQSTLAVGMRPLQFESIRVKVLPAVAGGAVDTRSLIGSPDPLGQRILIVYPFVSAGEERFIGFLL